MPTGVITGLVDSKDFLTTQRPEDWREGMMLLYPNSAMPLTALTSLMKSESASDPKINWHEKRFNPQRIELGADVVSEDGGLSRALTIVAGAANGLGGAFQLKADTLLYAEHTGEIMRVTADPASDTACTVIRGIGQSGVSMAAIDHNADGVNPYLTVMGSSFMEGQDVPTSISRNPVARTNYLQIFRDSLSITRTAQNTYLRTGDQVKEAKRECLEQHGIGMERAFLWGRPSESITGVKPRRTTEGICPLLESSYAATNFLNQAGAAMDLAELEDLLQKIFYYGSDEKMAFCGNTAILTINRIIRKNTGTPYTISEGQKAFGMNIQRLTCPFGSLVLKRHPLFNELPGGYNATFPAGNKYRGWDSVMLVLDMKNVKYRYLKNGDTKYLPNRQSNGLDGMTSEYLTECGLEFQMPETHYLVKGLTLAAADA